MRAMWGILFTILHYTAVLIVVARVLLRPRVQPSARLAWILVVEAVPILGLLAYLMFGEVRMRQAERRRAAGVRAALGRLWPHSPAVVRNPPPAAAPVIASMRATGGMEAVGGCRLNLLEESDAAIARMVKAIDEATREVHLLFYIWLPDVSGASVADALIRARARGVTVRLVVDALGSRQMVRSALWTRLQASGAHCARALPWGNPLTSWLFQRLDLRNHRKIVVIDNRLAFTGSRNCADMAFSIKPRFAPWVDVLLSVEGPVVGQLQSVFLQDWLITTGEDLGPDLGLAIGRDLLAVPEVEGADEIAQVMASGPDQRVGTLSDSIATLIYSARERLTITTPYYVPDEAINAAIRSAARRGVAVTLILPARNDSRIVAATSEGYFLDLLRSGVRLMQFKGGLIHAKIVTVDGQMTLIGSANLDRRSFDLNYEVNMLVVDPSVTAMLDDRQQSYVQRSHRVTIAEVEGWSRWRRVRNNLLAIAAPLI